MAMTARAERSAEEFIRAGFAGCLYKPFSRDELFAAVSHCIGKRENEAIAAADFSVLLRGEYYGTARRTGREKAYPVGGRVYVWHNGAWHGSMVHHAGCGMLGL